VEFDEFARSAGRRLRAGLIAAYGLEAGLESAAEALAYGWEHWGRLSRMDNPSGYLYRVGQTAARRGRRPQGFLPVPPPVEPAQFEPRLIPALERLSEQQRVVVVLTCAYGWLHSEVAELLEISASSVRTHQTRALAKLAQELEVSRHGD
jgi:DNA-directed RNA polymerase specialized sigma24 family protein